MKTMNLRDANQQFSKLVREIEETGEAVLVLRNGRPAIRLSAVASFRRTAEEQYEAKQRLMDPSSAFRLPDDWKFNREESHDDALSQPARQVNEAEAGKQLSRLVEEVEETGATIEILRNGEPAAELRPWSRHRAERKLTATQEAALKSLFETAHRTKGKSRGRRMTRDEMHER